MNINGLYLRNSLFFLLFFGVGVVPNASPKPSEGQPKCLERLAQAVDNQKKVQKRLNKCKKVCNKNKLQEDCDQYWDDQLKALQRAKHFPAEIDESGSTLNVNPGGTFIVKFRWDQPAPEPGNNDSWMVLFHPQEADETLSENWWHKWDSLSTDDISWERNRPDTYSSDGGEVHFSAGNSGTIYLTGKWISVKIHTHENNEISEDKTYKLHVIERNTDDKPHVVFPEVLLTIEPNTSK